MKRSELAELKGTYWNVFEVMKRLLAENPKVHASVTEAAKKNGWPVAQALWHAAFPNGRTTCLTCGRKTTFRRNGQLWDYNQYCANACAQKDPAHRQKVNESFRSNPDNKNIGEKIKATWREKYGVDCALNDPKVKAKKDATMLRRYGNTQPFKVASIRKKRQKTWDAKYNGHPMLSDEVKDKVKATWMSKHGVTNGMHVPEVFEKAQYNAHRVKQVELDGKKFNYQGFEGHALRILVDQLSVPAKKIVTAASSMPVIFYQGNKTHRYYPDIRVRHKSKDVCIEVKSDYTAGFYDKKTFQVVKAKAQAAFDADVDLRLWVVIPKSKKIVRINEVHELSFKAFKNLISPWL